MLAGIPHGAILVYSVRPRAGGALVGAYIGLQGHVEGHAWIEGTADTGLRPEGAAAILHSHPPFTSRHGILNEYTRIPYSAHPPMQPIRRSVMTLPHALWTSVLAVGKFLDASLSNGKRQSATGDERFTFGFTGEREDFRGISPSKMHGTMAKVRPACADVVEVNGKAFCAPSLFIAGVGKCGTNALSEHLGLHPHVARQNRELSWDPRETPSAMLAANRHILAVDSVRPIWIAKHPKYALASDVPALARRLKLAYPHAKLAVALCDPLALPWRRFLFLLSSAVGRHGDSRSAGAPETLRALASTLARLNSSVAELFAVAFNPLDSVRACRRDSPRSRALLESISAAGFSALYDNPWLRPGASGEAKCAHEWRLASSYVDLIGAWTGSLGRMNESVGVVYMEGWERDGLEYVRTLLRLLSLDAAIYPWREASNALARPVYQNVASKRLLLGPHEHDTDRGARDGERAEDGRQHAAASPAAVWLPVGRSAREAVSTCMRQCARLTRTTGMRPPWCSSSGEVASVDVVEAPCPVHTR